MATELQLIANRANAAKSTGPLTPEGKRISSRNGARHGLISDALVLKGESMRRFKSLAAALNLQFQPRNAVEASLVQTMAAARWRLLRLWGIQTATFEREMARQVPSAGSGAALAAVTFRNLADTSRVLELEHLLEAGHDRQYNRALTMLLKLREAPKSRVDSGALTAFPSETVTGTWEDDCQDEANFEAISEDDFICNESYTFIKGAPPR